MFSKKYFTKISFIIGIVSVLVYMFAFFAVQWRGATLVNLAPNIEITALAPVKAILVGLVGNDFGQLFNNIICINIVWYVVVGFPVWCFHWIKEVGFHG